MHGNSGNSDDDKLFEKIKGDAISSNWIYDQITFDDDFRKFKDAIKTVFGLGDLIDTRIHVSTDKTSVKCDDKFMAYLHQFDHVKKAYYAMLRDKT